MLSVSVFKHLFIALKLQSNMIQTSNAPMLGSPITDGISIARRMPILRYRLFIQNA